MIRGHRSRDFICEPNSETEGQNVCKLAYTGGVIAREQAWDYAQARAGKYLQQTDWDW